MSKMTSMAGVFEKAGNPMITDRCRQDMVFEMAYMAPGPNDHVKPNPRKHVRDYPVVAVTDRARYALELARAARSAGRALHEARAAAAALLAEPFDVDTYAKHEVKIIPNAYQPPVRLGLRPKMIAVRNKAILQLQMRRKNRYAEIAAATKARKAAERKLTRDAYLTFEGEGGPCVD